jgi:hypothetical protein
MQKNFVGHTLLLALSSAGGWVSEKKYVREYRRGVHYRKGRLCTYYYTGVADFCRVVVNCIQSIHYSVHSHKCIAALPHQHTLTLQPPSAGIHAEPYTDNLGNFLT